MDEAIIQVLARFFFEARGICGAEKTYHALFYHHLLLAGYSPTQVARECRLQKGPVDLVLFSGVAAGNFPAGAELALAAFEFKGGAYGNRNALLDQVKRPVEVEDIRKLSALRTLVPETWFVCIDLVHLGTALTTADVQAVAQQAGERGVSFAYFNQAEDQFLAAPPGRSLQPYPLVEQTKPIGPPALRTLCEPSSGFLRRLNLEASRIHGAEDNNAALMYHLLRREGYSPRQLSLETYFGFANRKTSRMHWRPDLAVFATGVAGQFNLYRNGDKRRSNDRIKLDSLQALVEIKGSANTERMSDRRLAEVYSSDIEKLGRWRALVSEAQKTLGCAVCQQPLYVFVGVDNRARPMAPTLFRDIRVQALEAGVRFCYLPKHQADAPATRGSRPGLAGSR